VYRRFTPRRTSRPFGNSGGNRSFGGGRPNSGGYNRPYQPRRPMMPRMIDPLAQKYPRNQEIRAEEVRLIDADKENVGVVSLAEAMRQAEEVGLDLIAISPQAKPPVCRIMDWQKFKYEISQKDKEQKKKQRHNQQKEIKIKSMIDSGDLNRKLTKIEEFLQEGRQVKLTVLKKGRQHDELYREFKSNLLTKLADYSNIVSTQDQERSMTIILSHKSKAVKHEAQDTQSDKQAH